MRVQVKKLDTLVILPLSAIMRATTLGILPILFYNIHAIYWVFRGNWENMLWVCHLASVLIGLGMLFAAPRLIAAGLLWITVGNVFWAIYLLGGGELIASSILTHIGSWIVGLVGLKRGGFPVGTWFRAWLGLILPHLAARFTPPAENVNLAHSIPAGWDPGSHTLYLAIVFAAILAGFAILERVYRRFSPT